jgi:putative PIN family toxin of toxin-antitoxin system
MRVVIDTSVIIAAWRSRDGASFAVVEALGRRRFEAAISVPLVFEYEAVLLRQLREPMTEADVHDFLDFVCAVSHHQAIFYLWRPKLRDPNDEMLVELAVASRSSAIVTHNVSDFTGIENLGVDVLTPAAFLRRLRGAQ